MENVLKKVEEFMKENKDLDFDDLEKFLNANFTKEEVTKYFEMMGDAIGGFHNVAENPMDALLDGPKEIFLNYEKAFVIEFPKEDRLRDLKVKEWPVWEKDVSEFEWHYDEDETCFIIEGEAEVKFDDKLVKFESGDLVKFKKGLSCTWKINKKIKKYYKFGDTEI